MPKKIFLPSCWNGEYKLAPSVHERLTTYLKSFKNGMAAHKLAVWLSRMNASPKRLESLFPIDRRALAAREDIGLTEAQIRGAIQTLLKVGFLAIVKPVHGGLYQRDEHGVRRIPIQYTFAPEFKKIFEFIARKTSSPKGRLGSKLLSVDSREAPPLGELPPSTAQPKLDLRGNARYIQPVNLSTIVEDGLRSALERLGAGIRARCYQKPIEGAST